MKSFRRDRISFARIKTPLTYSSYTDIVLDFLKTKEAFMMSTRRNIMFTKPETREESYLENIVHHAERENGLAVHFFGEPKHRIRFQRYEGKIISRNVKIPLYLISAYASDGMWNGSAINNHLITGLWVPEYPLPVEIQ